MPYKSKRKIFQPYCRKCGAFLVGGKNGYCPEKHEWMIQDLYDECHERLHTFPITHCEYNKILIHIKRLEEKYDKEIKLKQL